MVPQDFFLFFLLAFARNAKCKDVDVDSIEITPTSTGLSKAKNENAVTTTVKTTQTTETSITSTKEGLSIPTESGEENGEHLELSTQSKEVNKRQVEDSGEKNDVTTAIPTEKLTSVKIKSGEDEITRETTKSTTAKINHHVSPKSEKTSEDGKDSDLPKEEQKSKIATESVEAYKSSPPKSSSKKQDSSTSKSNRNNARSNQARQSGGRRENPSCEDKAAEESNPAPLQKNKNDSITTRTKKPTEGLKIENLVAESTSERTGSPTNNGSTTVGSTVPSANSTSTVPTNKWSSFFTKSVKKAIWAAVGVIGTLGIAYYIITSIS